MITEGEYLEAKKIVDEYERQQYQDNQMAAEYDLDYDEDWCYDEDEDDYQIQCATDCTCGAWQFSDGTPVHIADCVCGAD